MKKFLIIIALIFTGVCNLTAQDSLALQTDSAKNGNSMSLIELFSIYTDIWQNVDLPMSVSYYCPGIDIYSIISLPLGNSKINFNYGLGFSMHNLRSDAMPVAEVKYDSTISQFVETEKTIFQRIPEKVNNKEINYDINKLTLAYIDIPLELCYKTKNKKGKVFKFAAGFKAGYLLSSHTKYKGNDITGTDKDVKYKTYRIKNIEPLKYGATARLGYGKFDIFGYYSFSKLFKKDKGPEMYPVSVGICITPFS